jgi:HisJ family histidinol phosphate phosphatase
MPDIHGHAKGEHRPYTEERPIAYSARMLFLWFYHACRRASPRFLMVADHANYLTFEDPGAVNTVRRSLKLAQAGDLLGAAETAGVDVSHAALVSEGLRRGMRFSIGAEMDNDPRARPDAQNIIDAMRPDGIIRSVHFIPIQHPEKGADWLWPFDNEEFAALYEVVSTDQLWDLYIAKLVDDLEKLPAHVVGHFYAPATLGRWPAQKKLEEYEDRMLDVAHRRGLAVEINTRFLYRDAPEDRKKKYLDANARLIRKARTRRVGIAIGSDAHSPRDQGNAFDVVLKLLDDAKINEVVFPVAGRLARVALRATPEHLEAEAQARRQPIAPGSSITGYSRAELGLPEDAEGVAGRRSSARAMRDAGPKKRAAASSTPSTSRRSAESSSSASKAKAARVGKPVPPKKKEVKDSQAGQKKRPSAAPAKKPTKRPAKPATTRRKKSSPVRSGKKKSTSKPAMRRPAAKAAPGKKAVAKKPAPRPAAKPKPKRLLTGHAKKTAKKKKPAAKRR